MSTVYVRTGESPTSRTVHVGPVSFVISYETIIAFAVSGYGWCVSENVWSRTTGKHLTQETPIDKNQRLPHEEFKKRLAVVLDAVSVDSEALTSRLRHLDMFGAPVDTTDREAIESFLANA